MATEIERKFLVSGTDYKKYPSKKIKQGYLSTSLKSTVRIRTYGTDAYITIKGPTVGISRSEFEYAIPLADAELMLAESCNEIIEKTRYLCKMDNDVWEVDEFHGRNAGLVLAEIELQAEEQTFNKPSWVSTEVSDDVRYYNSNLACFPYADWESNQKV